MGKSLQERLGKIVDRANKIDAVRTPKALIKAQARLEELKNEYPQEVIEKILDIAEQLSEKGVDPRKDRDFSPFLKGVEALAKTEARVKKLRENATNKANAVSFRKEKLDMIAEALKEVTSVKTVQEVTSDTTVQEVTSS